MNILWNMPCRLLEFTDWFKRLVHSLPRLSYNLPDIKQIWIDNSFVRHTKEEQCEALEVWRIICKSSFCKEKLCRNFLRIKSLTSKHSLASYLVFTAYIIKVRSFVRVVITYTIDSLLFIACIVISCFDFRIKECKHPFEVFLIK